MDWSRRWLAAKTIVMSGEGIDTAQALYEWDCARQLLRIRALQDHQADDDSVVEQLFGDSDSSTL